MLTVHLSDLLFHAYHGIHEAESVAGGNFLVNMDVEYDEKHIKFNNIDNVINYEEVYHIISKRMAIASPLLEEVADTIIRKLKHRYSNVKVVTLSIYKLHPPIEGFQGKVGITLRKKFD